MTRKQKQALESYRKNALKSASDLCYSASIKEQVRCAVTEGEITRAMMEGRRSMRG